jgi:hypothetical protein
MCCLDYQLLQALCRNGSSIVQIRTDLAREVFFPG